MIALERFEFINDKNHSLTEQEHCGASDIVQVDYTISAYESRCKQYVVAAAAAAAVFMSTLEYAFCRAITQ